MSLRLCRVALAATLVLSVASSAVASCLARDSEASAQMACCKGGHHDCEPAMRAAQCCQSPNASREQFVAVKPILAVKPIAVLSYVSAGDLAKQPISPMRGHGSRPLTFASPPRFLLASALRL